VRELSDVTRMTHNTDVCECTSLVLAAFCDRVFRAQSPAAFDSPAARRLSLLRYALRWTLVAEARLDVQGSIAASAGAAKKSAASGEAKAFDTSIPTTKTADGRARVIPAYLTVTNEERDTLLSLRLRSLIAAFDSSASAAISLSDDALIAASRGGSYFCVDSLTMVLGLFCARAPGWESIVAATLIGGDTDRYVSSRRFVLLAC
jgi:ADP-ribosylglycohydrolase